MIPVHYEELTGHKRYSLTSTLLRTLGLHYQAPVPVKLEDFQPPNKYCFVCRILKVRFTSTRIIFSPSHFHARLSC